MPRIERNFEQTLKNLKRDVVELKRTSQASLVGYVDKETGKIKDSIEDLVIDARTPAAPVELVTDFYVYESFHEKLREGYITITSAPVTKATDGSDIQVAKYEMWARSAVYESGSEPPFELQSSAIDPSLRSLPVEQYKPYEVMMRAVTLTGRPGLFSEIKTVTVTDDDAPPPMPSKLTLDQRLAVVEMTWDGLSFGETLMPLDFWRTEIGVRYGGASEYTVITEWFEEAGIRYYAGAPVNELLYISHRSYDYAGNASEWTEPATITVTPVVDEESIRLRLEEVQSIIDQVGDELDQTRLQLVQELSDANDRLDQNDQQMDKLVNTDLPALNQELVTNTNIINNLNDVVLPDLNTRLSDAEGDLAQSKIELDGRLDQAEADIGNAESNLTNLNTVTIPALNTRLDNAQSEIDTNQTELTNRLDDAFLDIDAAQDTADGAATAASNAQSAADSAKDYAEAQLALLISQGQNLVRNGDFEAGQTGWRENSFASVVAESPRSGSMSLKIGPNPGGNIWPTSEWVPSSSGRTYYAEYWIKRTGDEAINIGVGFVIQSKTASGGTSTPISGRVDSISISTTEFTKVSVTFSSGTDDVTHVRFAPWINAGNNIYHIDDFLAVDVTEAQEALKAAADAQAKADSAHTLAGTAQSRADAAYTMAGSKNAVYYSSSEPSGNGTSAGDLWRRRNSSREIIGEWQWTGSAWEKQTVSGSNVSNMDIGYLTAGAADISDAVIDKLWADVITARKIMANQVLIGSGSNLIPNANVIEDLGGWAENSSTGLTRTVSGNGPTPTTPYFYTNTQGNIRSERFSVEGGQKYRFRISARSSISTSHFYVQINTDGGSNPYPILDEIMSTTWKEHTGWITMPENATWAYVNIYANHENGSVGTQRFAFPSLVQMSDGELIVNGSISGDHLDVNSVAAKVATVMKLDVGSLTASSATIDDGVVNKLWADVIRARKITTDMLVVGQGDNMIPWDLSVGDEANWANFDGYGPASSITPGRQIGAGVSNGNHLFMVVDGVSAGVDTNTWRIGKHSYVAPNGASGWVIEPGEEYHASMYVRAGGSYTSYPDVRIGLYFYGGNGQYISSSTNLPKPLNWTWTKHEVSGVAPGNAARVLVYVRQNQPGGVRVDLPALYKKTDGSLIVTGSITGDHLEVNSVATKVATVIKLNASTITSGTINTARLNTSAIAAATASIQKVNASNIVATSATFDDAVINKLWAEVISARKITADQVLIGSGLNVLPNAGFTNEAWDGFGRNVNNGPDGQPSIWISGEKTLKSPVFSVDGGKKYKFIHSFMQSEFSSYYIQIITDGGNIYLVSNKKYVYKNTWYEKIEVEFTMPEGATYARIRIFGNHPNGPVTTGYQWYTNLGLFQMTDASLVVDGAILAEHITASKSLSAKVGEFLTVEAGMIKANAVTAGAIAGGAIDGKMITGATVRNSSSSSRVEMNSTGLHAWKSSVKTFQLLASTGSVTAEGGVFTGSTFRTTSNSSRGIQMDKYYLRAWNRSGGETLRVSASTGDVTLTGGTLQTMSASNRGVKFDSSGFRAYDSVGNVMVDIGGSFNRFAGRIASGPSSEPGATILPPSEHAGGYSGYWLTKQAGVLGGSETAGIWLEKPSATYVEPLQVRGLNNGGVNIWGRLYAKDMYAGAILGPGGYYKIQAANGSWFNGSVKFNGRLLAKNTPSTTLMTNAHIAVDGTLYKSSSAARYKLFPLSMDESYDDKILSIEAKTWIDKHDAEATGELMVPVTLDRATNPDSDELPSTASGAPLRRVPGVIAEEVRDAGLGEFVIYDGDGQVEGVMYERLGVALIPVVKRLRERVVSLEDSLSDAIGRLDAAGL